MKQFATFLLLLVIMIPLAETAHAKDEIITYEQLLAIDETMHSICRGQDWRSLSDAYERNLDVKYTMAMAYKR